MTTRYEGDSNNVNGISPSGDTITFNLQQPKASGTAKTESTLSTTGSTSSSFLQQPSFQKSPATTVGQTQSSNNSLSLMMSSKFQQQSPFSINSSSIQSPTQMKYQQSATMPPPRQNQQSYQNFDQQQVIKLIQHNRIKQLTLERLNQSNQRLKDYISKDMIKASNAALMVVRFTEDTKEPLLPGINDNADSTTINRYKAAQLKRSSIGGHGGKQLQMQDGGDGCCVIM
ncbi:unnamed protein product [Ambrosiozyma monospora]|uniref:Unnamed protein product n=1 Tax=Ambrosiozyma monospora TaxID=43982 RepID=A0ACB5TE55_AMBMO|nr:unnamed protein product [Ambrosiozyma monospora]